MARQISKGTCSFCHRELSKASMTRHLQSCEQRAAMQGERESRQQAKKSKAFHLVVEGYRLPMYWMHLEVAAGITLATLDRFLRDILLECCGHLSVFRIDGLNYYVDADENSYWWDMRRRTMQVKVKDAFSPGQTCSYEYDFGSTTELLVKVLAEDEVEMKGADRFILTLSLISTGEQVKANHPWTKGGWHLGNSLNGLGSSTIASVVIHHSPI